MRRVTSRVTSGLPFKQSLVGFVCHFTMPHFTQLINWHLAVDSSGNVSELSSCSNCYMAKCFPEKSGRCRNEELGALSGPTDWIPRYIRTYHLLFGLIVT